MTHAKRCLLLLIVLSPISASGALPAHPQGIFNTVFNVLPYHMQEIAERDHLDDESPPRGFQTWGEYLEHDARSATSRLYSLAEFSAVDFDLFVEMASDIARAELWNGIPRFTNASVPHASCRDEAYKIGMKIFNADRTTRYVEPDRTIEKICTPEVFAAQDRYNEALDRIYEQKHYLEHLHLLAEAVEAQAQKNSRLLRKWSDLTKRSVDEKGRLDLRRINEPGIRADLSREKASTYVLIAAVSYYVPNYAKLPVSMLTILNDPLTLQAIAFVHLEKALKTGAVPHSWKQTSVTNFRALLATLFMWLEEKAFGSDAVLRYRPSPGFVSNLGSLPIANISNVFAAGAAREQMRDNARNYYLREYPKHEAESKALYGKLSADYLTQQRQALADLNQRVTTQIPSAREVVKHPVTEMLEDRAQLSREAEAIKRSFEFKSPAGPDRHRLESTWDNIAHAEPTTGTGRRAQSVGLIAVREADGAFARGEMETGRSFGQVAEAMTDIALGFVPILGPAKFLYEGLTGYSIFGRKLTPTMRALSLAGAVLGGVASLNRLEGLVAKLAGADAGVLGAEAVGAEAAIGEAQKIVNATARVEEFNPLRPGVLHSAPLGEGVVADTFRNASYVETITSSETKLYRTFSRNETQLSSWWSRTKPAGPYQATLDLALDPSFKNQADKWVEITTPGGTHFFEGIASELYLKAKGSGESVGRLLGGGSQVYFLDNIPKEWITGGGVF